MVTELVISVPSLRLVESHHDMRYIRKLLPSHIVPIFHIIRPFKVCFVKYPILLLNLKTLQNVLLNISLDILIAHQFREIVDDNDLIPLVETLNLLDQPLLFLGKLIDNNHHDVALA